MTGPVSKVLSVRSHTVSAINRSNPVGSIDVCVSVAKNGNSLFAGNGEQINGFTIETNIGNTINRYERNTNETVNEPKTETEPMFNFGIFDGPLPDTTGFENYESSSFSESSSTVNQSLTGEGGEFSQFIADVGKEDVRTYLRLGHACGSEGRLERAKEHY